MKRGDESNEEESMFDGTAIVTLSEDTIVYCVTEAAKLEAEDCSIEATVPIFEGIWVENADVNGVLPAGKLREARDTETHTKLVQP